jgi:uncharacterized protein (UPF0332 family)
LPGTHKGVQSEFYRLSRDDGRVDAGLRAFLSRAYAYKAIADFETGPEDTTSPEDARHTAETARRFVREFARLALLSGATD